MKRLLFLLLFLPALYSDAVFASDTSASYYIPPSQFSGVMQVMDMGFANIFALFRTGTGSFTFDDTNKSISNLRLAIDAASLLAATNENQRDLSGFLGAYQYPEIRVTAPDSVTFTDNKAQIKATLTLHGNSKPITLDATLNRSGKSPHGGGMWTSEGEAVGISLRGTFKRGDFGLSENPETPERFGDTITLMLEMQAIRQ